MIPKGWHQVSFTGARNNPPATPDFCLPNLVAGSVGFVAAPAGIGKTSLLMQIGVAVAAGVPVAGNLLDTPDKTGRVVMLATEDPPTILQRRAHFLMRSLEARNAGTDLVERLDSNLVFYSAQSGTPTLLLDDGALSEHGIDLLHSLALGSRLLILDPIRRFHYRDEQDYSQMALLFGVLSDMAASTGCTILFSHHVPQPTSEVDMDSPVGALGSNAFINMTRWVVNMTGMSRKQAQSLGVDDDERRRYVLASFTKSNYGPAIPARWLRRSVEFEGVLEACEFSHPLPENQSL
jgi:hypothetical protein